MGKLISGLKLIRNISRFFIFSTNRFILKILGAKFGKNFRTYSVTSFSSPWKLSFGDNVWIGKDCAFYAENGIKIGNNVIVAKDCSLISGDHVRNKHGNTERIKKENLSIIIQDGAWIGEKVIILKKVTIGKMAVVGAGSVVTHNVPPFSVVAGNPARIIKSH